LLGGIPLPLLPGVSEKMGETGGVLHEALAWVLIALIVLHAAAGLKHQFIDRNRAAGRMPPFRDPVDEPVVIGQGGNRR
jgi:cytochrome b561